MKLYFPGTVIERNGQNAEAFLFGVFAITKGLMLAQVREITGPELGQPGLGSEAGGKALRRRPSGPDHHHQHAAGCDET